MKYEIKYDPKAEKQLEKIPQEIARRIIKKMRKVGDSGHGIETILSKKWKEHLKLKDF